METVRTVTYSDIWLDELNNVRYSTDFELHCGPGINYLRNSEDDKNFKSYW